MDIRHIDVEPTDEERAAVDALLGPAPSSWQGSAARSTLDTRVARVGREARTERHMLLPALDAVQSEIGWISEGALGYICRRLTVPPAEAYGVATFYALLSIEERPPIVLHVCDDICCAGRGAEEIIGRLEADVGPEGTVREGVTWFRSPCLGQCDRAPAVFVQRAGRDDATIAPAHPGTLLEDARDDVAAVSGSQMELLGRPASRSLEEYRLGGGYAALDRAVEMGPQGVIDEIRTSNLRGRGGAAFPTGVKWQAVADSTESTRYLVCNADESEPGTFKDRTLMESSPHALVEAMTVAAYAVGATEGYLYIRGEYPLATRALRSAIDEARSEGLLGTNVAGLGFSFDIAVRRGQGAYICGEETALFNSIEGHRGEPRQKPPFPTTHGLFGFPTVVNNVETLINGLAIVQGGGAAFAEVGTADSTGTRLFCLSGDVVRPGVVEMPFGATLREVIDAAGVDGELQAVLLGGAAGSFVGTDRLDMPLTFEDTRAAGLSLGSGVVMVFNQHRDMTTVSRRIARFFRDESCGQCVPCRVGTVRVEEALARAANGSRLDVDLLAELDGAMKDASICGLGHTAATAIRSAVDLGLVRT